MIQPAASAAWIPALKASAILLKPLSFGCRESDRSAAVRALMSTRRTCLPAACSAWTIPGNLALNAGRLASSVPLVEMITVPTRTVASGTALVIWSMSARSRSAAVGIW
ncbi:hypothetical protein RKD19_000488 [Streptomyces canus]